MALTISVKVAPVALIGLIFIYCNQIQCIKLNNIEQCTFIDYSRTVQCRNIYAPAQLFQISTALSYHKINYLEFLNSKLRFWPLDIFLGTEITTLHFENCELFVFEEIDSIGGLEGYVKELNVFDTILIEERKWRFNLSSLKQLEILHVTKNKIPKLAASISSTLPDSLIKLNFIDCGIEEIEVGFFSQLKNIEYLSLQRNKIKSLSKELEPLPHLTFMDLTKNEIMELPENFMLIFPNINNLILRMNKLQHLPENIWKGMLENMQNINVGYNPLICDSDMRWIADVKKPDIFPGKCAEPEKLVNKSLNALASTDFDTKNANT